IKKEPKAKEETDREERELLYIKNIISIAIYRYLTKLKNRLSEDSVARASKDSSKTGTIAIIQGKSMDQIK
ncbi:unnamed protein product, partial [Dovyalis caffra]